MKTKNHLFWIFCDALPKLVLLTFAAKRNEHKVSLRQSSLGEMFTIIKLGKTIIEVIIGGYEVFEFRRSIINQSQLTNHY